MFIESRFELPRIKSAWAPVLESFRIGLSFEAFEAGQSLASGGAFVYVEDLLVWADILRAVGRERESLDLFRNPSTAFGADIRTEVQIARTLSARGRVLASIRRLESARSTLASGDVQIALLEAERASELAGIYLANSALAAVESVQSGTGAGHPWVRYGLAYAYFRLRRWKPALELFMGISVDCPQWPRPWVLAHRCLSSLGRADDASAIAAAARERFPQDWRVLITLVEDHIARNRWAALADLLDSEIAKWSATVEDITPLKALLVRSRWRSYETSEAIDVARTFDTEFAARLEKLQAASYFRRFRLPVPSIVQDRYLCVSTSVAMVLRFCGEGAAVDPAVLHAEMDAGDGVASWQLDRWCDSRGYRAVDIRAEVDAIRGMLDEGFPLLACRQGVLMSHMEVIVGYDDALEEIEVIDPDQGLPHAIAYEAVKSIYGMAGEALVALLPNDDAAVMQKVDRGWIDTEASIVRRARRHLHDGAIDDARALLAEFPPGSRRRRFLTLEAGEAFAPSHALREAVHALATDPEVDPTTRFNLALGLFANGAEEDAEKILREFERPIPRVLNRYRRAMCTFWKGDVRGADRRLRVLVEQMPGAEEVWFTLALLHRALGRTADADRALENCLEMAPFHLNAGLEKIRFAPKSTPIDELAERARSIVARHPSSINARSTLARLEHSRGDGLAVESCWREYLRLVPFSDAARSELRQWYLRQDRTDLAGALVDSSDPERREDEASAGDFASTLGRAWEEYQTCARGAASSELAERLASGGLKLEETVECALLEVNFRLREANASGAIADLSPVLPARLPLPVRERLASFLGRIDHRWTTPPAATQIADWSDAVVPREDLTPAGRLARTYLDEMAGTTNQARVTYLEIAESAQIDEAYHRAGVIAFRRGDYGDALENLRRCVALTPGYVDSWELITDIGHAVESPRHVLEGLERRTRIAPYDENVAGQYLDALARMAGIGEAQSWLETAAPRFTESFAAWWRIELLGMAGAWTEVLGALSESYRSASPREALGFELQALDALGRTADYQTRLGDARERFPDDPYFNDLHARTLVNVDPSAARDVHRKMLVSRPDVAAARIVSYSAPAELVRTVLESVLDSSLSTETREEAIRSFARALDAPKHAATKLAVFEQLAAEDSPAALVYGVLSSCYVRSGRHADAERAARACYALDPYNPSSTLHLGSVLVETNPAEALAMLREAHGRTADSRALGPIAKALRKLNRLKESVEAFHAAVQADPADGEAIVAMAEIGGGGPRLFEACQSALRLDWIPATPRFAVVAVESAMANRRPLLWTWERAAADRYAEIEASARDAAAEAELGILTSMLYVWGTTLGRPLITSLVAPATGRHLKLEALTRLKPWRKNQEWMPTRAALERRAAVACAKYNAARDAEAANGQKSVQ